MDQIPFIATCFPVRGMPTNSPVCFPETGDARDDVVGVGYLILDDVIASGKAVTNALGELSMRGPIEWLRRARQVRHFAWCEKVTNRIKKRDGRKLQRIVVRVPLCSAMATAPPMSIACRKEMR